MTDELHPLPNSTTDAEAQKINPLEVSVQLANEERYLDAFTNWFGVPLQKREEAIKGMLTRLDVEV